MESWLIVLLGTVVFVGGIVGSINYKAVHRWGYKNTMFENSPPGTLLIPLWMTTGIGATFILMGIFR